MSANRNGHGTGVVVLGMHRSGTSAVAGLVHLAGVPLPAERYLLGGSKLNPKGFFEVRPLNVVNETLLKALGGEWSAPPRLPAGWTASPAAGALKARGRRRFTSIMPSDAWLWKDPRLCLTLPFWRDVIGRPVVVMVLRNPLEVSRSLQHRNSFPHPLVLALWEEYTHAAVAGSAGLPVAVLEYESVIADPLGSCRGLRDWAVRHGVRCAPMASDEVVRGQIDAKLRHVSHTVEDLRADPAISPQQIELMSRLLDVTGYHESFEPPALPETTPATAALLEERRAARGLARSHHRRRRAFAKKAVRLVRRGK